MKNFLKSKWGIVTISIVVILVLVIAYLAVATFSTDIYKNIYAGDVNIGGLSQSEALDLFELKNDTLPETVSFVCNGEEFNIYTEDFAVNYDFEATVDNAYKYGRDENIFKRCINVIALKFNKKVIPFEITFDPDKLNNILNDKFGNSITPVVDYSVELVDDAKLVILNGVDGYGADMEKVYENIVTALSTFETEEKINVELKTLEAKQLDIDEFFKTHLREPKDAYFTDEKNLQYEEHVVGISFDKETAKKIIEENKTNTEPYEIAVKVTYPNITLNKLLGKAFEDTLGSYSSTYNAGDAGRTKNVTLAASKINGTILAPGESFSFNNVVGARTYEAGFRNAKVYQGNEIVDGLGGGICQVSSTLYNAVLYANLEIVTRRNHSLAVSYVPLGRDATVSYGAIDFVFRNNRKAPVKITASASGGNLYIAVMGIKDDDIKIELYTETVASRAFEVKEVVDPALAPGETVVKQNGSNGYTINTYKVVKSGGTSKTEFVSKSIYLPTNKIVNVGATEEMLAEQLPTDVPTNGEEVVVPSMPSGFPSGFPYDIPEETDDIPQSNVPIDVPVDAPVDVLVEQPIVEQPYVDETVPVDVPVTPDVNITE